MQPQFSPDWLNQSPTIIGFLLMGFILWKIWKGTPAPIMPAPARTGLEWLEQIAEDDRAHLRQRLSLQTLYASPQGLGHNPPYLDFNFEFFNGSVFEVFLTGEMDGHLRLVDGTDWDAPQRERPEFSQRDGGPRVAHGDPITLQLRQFLPVEVAAHLQELREKREPIRIRFANLKVYVAATNDNSNQTVTLPMPEDWTFHL